MTAPDPLVSADVDLSKIDGFMMDTARLLGSELVAISSGDEFKAAVLLWARAWQQKPHCSLPDDARVLASFAMVAPGKWTKIKDVAMRGFVLCNDGRWYHRVLSEDAKRAWRAVSQRREAIRKRYEQPTAVGQPNDSRTTIDGRVTGRDESKKEESAAPNGAPIDLKAIVFGPFLDYLVQATGKSRDACRSLAGKWCKTYGDAAVIEAGNACQGHRPLEPIGWLTKALAERRQQSPPKSDWVAPGLG